MKIDYLIKKKSQYFLKQKQQQKSDFILTMQKVRKYFPIQDEM